MRHLYDPVWITVAVVLSFIVAVVGYPAFERSYGFPLALVWTLVCVAGVWLTYFIRAFFWSKKAEQK